MFIARRFEVIQSCEAIFSILIQMFLSQVILFNGNVNMNSKGAATGENSFYNRSKTLDWYDLSYGPNTVKNKLKTSQYLF